MFDNDIQTKNAMIQEAISRMNRLRLNAEICDGFESNGQVVCSNYGNVMDIPEDIQTKIKIYEERFGGLIYHVVHSRLWDCDIYNCLSVSKYKSDWNYENMLITHGWAMAYTINLSIPEFSESGSIQLQQLFGTLLRVN